MDFSFLNGKLVENIEQYLGYLFYEGYQVGLFMNVLLTSVINKTSGSVYLLNFNERIIDYLYNDQTHKILKAHPKVFQTHSVISLNERILLLDLISGKLSKETLSCLIIYSNNLIDNDSKLIFLMKYLRSSSIKIIIISSNAYYFYRNINTIISYVPIEIEKITMHFIPRFHTVTEKIINYEMNYRQVRIDECNMKYDRKMNGLLMQLKNIGIDEIVYSLMNGNKDNEEIVCKLRQWISNMLMLNNKNCYNDYYGVIGSDCYKRRVLMKDVLSICYLLERCDDDDYPSLLGAFDLVLSRQVNEENSLFNYQDMTTANLIGDIINELKGNIYTIVKVDADEIINDEKIISIDQFLEVLSIKDSTIISLYKDILHKYQLKLHNTVNHFNSSFSKISKLISILEDIKVNENSSSKNEKIMIIGKSSHCVNTIQQALFSHFSLKDSFKAFYDNKLQSFLLMNNEIIKRQNVLNGNKYDSMYFIESLLLQYECFLLCQSSNKQNENLFTQIFSTLLKENDPSSVFLMPSQVDLCQDNCLNIITEGMYNENTILPPHYITVNSYSNNHGIDELMLVNDLINREIKHVIIYDFDMDLLRLIESIIVNNNSTCQVNHITMINNVSSYDFISQMNHSKIEYTLFYKLINQYQQVTKDNNDKEEIVMSNSEEKQSNPLNNILIDYREMNAKLPFYLYEAGFNLIVGSLEIGDYIPSNTCCIERKSITTNDLISSLKSTRLTNQIVKMEKYYDQIIILCEFDTFGEVKELMSKKLFNQKNLYKKFIDIKNISSKILYSWTFSPSMTVKLIQGIKQRKDSYLDINKCLNANKMQTKKKTVVMESQPLMQSPSKQQTIIDCFNNSMINEHDNNEGDINSNEDNKDSKSILLSKYEKDNNKEIEKDNQSKIKRIQINIERFIRKIDGITSTNYPLVLKNFQNLRDLITCPQQKLYNIFGRINGNRINIFLSTKYNIPQS